jgi:hypothetical protein
MAVPRLMKPALCVPETGMLSVGSTPESEGLPRSLAGQKASPTSHPSLGTSLPASS